MTMINVTQESLESVIETGLSILGHNNSLPKSNIHALVEFILNYYTPDEEEETSETLKVFSPNQAAALSAQFIGETR